MDFINAIFDFLCGIPLLVALFSVGIFLSIRLRGIQIRYMGRMFLAIKKSSAKTEGVSGFSAFCASVGGQIGAANLAGVASAIMTGGPGSVFWMWVTAILGMATNFTEVVLGILYRDKGFEGTPVGGPSYYIKKGLNCHWLAFLYSSVVVVGIGIFYAMMQSNVIASAVLNVFPRFPRYAIALLLTFSTFIVAIGGFKRVAKVTSFLVPIMSLSYILLAFSIILLNISKLPYAFEIILRSAFTPRAIGSGFLGYTIREAIRIGAARGLFSNDAGNGKAAALNAGATIKHPVDQGILGMLSVFFDTIIMCTATAAIILVTDVADTGLSGLSLTTEASKFILGDAAPFFMLILMFLLGFTTLIADISVGSSSLAWMLPAKPRVIQAFRIIACLLLGLGAFISLETILSFIDFMSALMVFINLVPLLLLSPKVVYVLKDYESQLKKGISQPLWDFDQDIDELL